MVNCARDGRGGIKGMLHKEYGARNSEVNSNATPLVDDTGKLTKSSPWTLWIVEVGDETNGVLLTVDMTM